MIALKYAKDLVHFQIAFLLNYLVNDKIKNFVCYNNNTINNNKRKTKNSYKYWKMFMNVNKFKIKG